MGHVLAFTAVLSAESGLALAPAEDALPVGRPGAAARAALQPVPHRPPVGRRADPDLLRLAKVVVEGDEPVAVRQVQRHLLLHRLQRDKEKLYFDALKQTQHSKIH